MKPEATKVVTVNGREIGERVGTEVSARLIDGEIYEAYFSKIEVDRKLVFIRDDSYKTGCVHAFTRKEARKLAIEARDRIIANINQQAE